MIFSLCPLWTLTICFNSVTLSLLTSNLHSKSQIIIKSLFLMLSNAKTIHFNIKDSHSNNCLPFDSYVPAQRKKDLIMAETFRAAQRSSNEENKMYSIKKIQNRFALNKYPSKFINDHTFRDSSRSVQDKPDPVSFIKLPFNNEKQKCEINQLFHRTDLYNIIRPIYLTNQPLSRSLRRPFNQPSCPSNCLTCKTAQFPGYCYTKNILYLISCKMCGKVYVGQSKRTARSRIKEDITSPNLSLIHI